MTNIEQLLENQGGILSGELAELIANTDNIEADAARKRVQRLISPIHKVTGLFSEKQSFVYHSKNYNSPAFFDALYNAFESSAKRCFAIVTAIKYHHGLIVKTDLPSYSFSPTSRIKGHVLFSTLMEKLIKHNVVVEYDEQHYSLNQNLAGLEEPNYQYVKAIQFAKNMVLSQFANWSRNVGLCSFNKGLFNQEIGGFQFSFGAPSYINGFVQYKESVPKPGFIVVDVLIGNSTAINEIDFFIQKISAIRASNPTIRLFPVLILDGVEVTAMSKLKKMGIMIGTIRELFGESYNELLKTLVNTITNAGAILKRDPESYIKLMTQLTKLVEGKTNNLRGDLFELAVGYYYAKHCQSLDVGKRVRVDNDTKTRDIDVLATYEKEVKAIECKGYKYPIDEEFVEIYLKEKIPSIKKWLEKTFPNRKQAFEIWSTGGFTDGAIQLLSRAKAATKRYSIDYLGKEEILQRATQLQTDKFTEILREYYFKGIF